jgi:hypothetical protein
MNEKLLNGNNNIEIKKRRGFFVMAKKGMSRPTQSQYQGSGQKKKSRRDAPTQPLEKK